MTGPHSETEDTKQISVAELLARNGSGGAPTAARRRRRRRGDSDAVTVAELTGEIPVIRDERHEDRSTPPHDTEPPAEPAVEPPAEPPAEAANRRAEVAEPPARPVAEPVAPAVAEGTAEREAQQEPQLNLAQQIEQSSWPVYWAEPEPRWPKSESLVSRKAGPERSEYPRPLRHTGAGDADEAGQQSGAEHMSPDPVGHYTDAAVDVMDSEVREAESGVEDSAYVRSYLQGPAEEPDPAFAPISDGTLFGGQSIADEVARRRSEQPPPMFDDDLETDRADRPRGALASVGRGLVTLMQSILAVAFGAGLFIAFDQLWRWNAIVALVLSVLVILGLVVGVRVVRRTEDIASTLIAVVVGLLITLGPMALLQSS